MLARILAIGTNTYREAVRARVLLGVFAVALATSAYSLVVATLSLHNETRVVADLGAASLSLYGILVAIVLGSTSLYRELEHKTVFPILSRPIARWEYLLGKYVGALLTVGVFVAVDGGVILGLLALEAGQAPGRVATAALGLGAVLAIALVRMRRARVYVLVPWSVAAFAAGWYLAGQASGERQLVCAAAALALSEVAIVAAVATLFSSFSSPFLTATFTAMVFVIGRSADTLAHLPPRVFGSGVASAGRGLARLFPNLHVYVPPRSLLLGQVQDTPVWPYVGLAALHALLYVAALLAVSTMAFARRDFA